MDTPVNSQPPIDDIAEVVSIDDISIVDETPTTTSVQTTPEIVVPAQPPEVTAESEPPITITEIPTQVPAVVPDATPPAPPTTVTPAPEVVAMPPILVAMVPDTTPVIAPVVVSEPTTDMVQTEIVTITDIVTTDIQPTAPILTPIVPVERLFGIGSINNLLQTSSNARGFSINAVSKNNTKKVNEFGIFSVDDLSGKLAGIAPGQAGYLQAAIDRSRAILTTLDGTFFSSDSQEIDLDPNRIYGFIQVEDGSLGSARQQLNSGETPTNIRFSLPDSQGNSPIKVTENSTNDGYLVSVNNDELVLNITQLDGVTADIPIGSKFQGSIEGRTIDFTDFTNQNLTVDITTKSDAAYKNSIGFYTVEDAIGTIKTTTGTFVKPGDLTYAAEAVKSAIANAGLQAGKTDSKVAQSISGGKIYAPVLVAQGDFNEFLSQNANNVGGGDVIHAYFNYVGANPDKVDHFRVVGTNTFAAEDLFGGGDKDYNDLVVRVNVKSDAQFT
jgi:Domain of unknown function (DUF4114)